MVTGLVQIREAAEAKAHENLDFRRYLRQHHRTDDEFYAVGREVEAQIDCRQCANCCRETRVEVNEQEIAAIAEFLSTGTATAFHEYTELDPGSHQPMLKQVHGECVFLDGNLCMIYDARPGACRHFPYVDQHEAMLGGRMESICRHSSICPILFNALEIWKRRVGFDRD